MSPRMFSGMGSDKRPNMPLGAEPRHTPAAQAIRRGERAPEGRGLKRVGSMPPFQQAERPLGAVDGYPVHGLR